MAATTAYEINTYADGTRTSRIYRDRTEAVEAVTTARAALGEDYKVHITTLLRPDGYPIDLRFYVTVGEFLDGLDSTEDC